MVIELGICPAGLPSGRVGGIQLRAPSPSGLWSKAGSAGESLLGVRLDSFTDSVGAQKSPFLCARWWRPFCGKGHFGGHPWGCYIPAREAPRLAPCNRRLSAQFHACLAAFRHASGPFQDGEYSLNGKGRKRGGSGRVKLRRQKPSGAKFGSGLGVCFGRLDFAPDRGPGKKIRVTIQSGINIWDALSPD